MALVVYEQQETRSDSFSNGKETGSRKFRVYDDASAITVTETIRQAFGDGSLPAIGDRFPGSTTMFARSFSITHVPDSLGLWEVEFTYENVEPGQYQPQELGYTEFSIEYSAELRDMWRAQPGLTFPNFGSPGADNRLCAGRAIDVAGVPMSVLHRFSTLTISETVAASTVSDRSILIRQARGRRNNQDFYGAPQGQVLYLGASANRIALDKFQITHRFSQDSHYHMIQTPTRGPNGQVTNLVRDSLGELRAGGVYWVQPFGEFFEMNSLSENF